MKRTLTIIGEIEFERPLYQIGREAVLFYIDYENPEYPGYITRLYQVAKDTDNSGFSYVTDRQYPSNYICGQPADNIFYPSILTVMECIWDEYLYARRCKEEYNSWYGNRWRFKGFNTWLKLVDIPEWKEEWGGRYWY